MSIFNPFAASSQPSRDLASIRAPTTDDYKKCLAALDFAKNVNKSTGQDLQVLRRKYVRDMQTVLAQLDSLSETIQTMRNGIEQEIANVAS